MQTVPKYKVLHLVDSSGLYGAETVILNLSREMMKSEFAPIVGMISRDNTTPELAVAAERLGIETMIVQTKFSFDPSGAFGINNYLAKQKIDIVHSHGYKPSLLAFLPGLVLKIPLMVTCHLWLSTGNAKLRFYHAMESRVMKVIPAVVGVSEEICREIVAKGVDYRKVKLIHNGVDLSNYPKYPKEDAFALIRKMKINESDFVIGTAGRLHWQKAYHYLLDAVKVLRDRNILVKCVVFGDGPLRKDLEAQRNELGLQDIVCFPGFRNDLVNLFDNVDIFVLTSVDEGLPMVLLEAMASRKAIISTPVGAINKVLTHGKDVLFYDTGDIDTLSNHIIYLKNNPARRKELGEAAYHTFTSGFSGKIMAEKYVSLYHSLLTSRKKNIRSGKL